jgi:hypothetical protein
MAAILKDKDGGYGVCGAKNIYTSTVRIGNWLEDLQGEILKTKDRKGSRLLLTEQNDKYNPMENRTTMEAPPSMKFVTTEELIQKNKEGSPYDLLFAHGRDIGAQARYTTNHADKFNHIGAGGELPHKYIEKMHDRKINKDYFASVRFTTTAREMQAYRDNGPEPDKILTDKLDTLPRWNKQCLISSRVPPRTKI